MPNPLPMPCANVNDCFPCFVLPTTNTSAEDQDCLQDFSIQWGNIQNNTPPLGSLFSSNGCVTINRPGGGGGTGVSIFSNSCAGPTFVASGEVDAFLVASINQVNCVHTKWNHDPQPPPVCLSEPCGPTPGGRLPLPPDPPFPVFNSNPASCIVNCPDGTPFTFTLPAGAFAASSQILADRMALSFACKESTANRICLSVDTTDICLGIQGTVTFIAIGEFLDPEANVWELSSGALPPGFNFETTLAGPTLPITGTPTAAGSYTFHMRVTAPNGNFMDKQFTLCVLDIIPQTLPDAAQGTAYNVQLGSTSCGQLFTWEVVSGALPPGITLDPGSGILSGTPTQAGTYNFEVGAMTAEA